MQLKVVVVGPQSTGKTTIANYLSGQQDNLINNKVEPTSGVRILEFDLQTKDQDIQDVINIEMWDASGDYKYEDCWKAIIQDTDAVVLVYNPDTPGQDQEIGHWFEYFVRKNNLSDEHCLVFAHRKNKSTERFRSPPILSRVTSLLSNGDSGGEMKDLFQNFIKDIYSTKTRK